MYETGLLHPETAYEVWFVHSCSLKLAVTMFTPTELECCHQNLAAHRLVVPDPAPTFSIARDIWPLTQAQLDMGTIAQQQEARKVSIDHIRDSGDVLRTDGCYCTTPRTELARRFHHGVATGPPTKCQLYIPRAPLSILGRAFPRPPYKVFFSPSYLRAALTSTWAAWLSHGSLPQSAKEPSKLANSQYTLNVGHPFRRSNDANGDHTVLLRCPPRVLNPM